MPSRLSCELPATPGWPDQYAISGERHPGARNECVSDDIRFSASSRNSIDSFRCSMRRAYSDSLGQIFWSQSCRIGKIDNINATQTSARDLIGSSKLGSTV